MYIIQSIIKMKNFLVSRARMRIKMQIMILLSLILLLEGCVSQDNDNPRAQNTERDEQFKIEGTIETETYLYEKSFHNEESNRISEALRLGVDPSATRVHSFISQSKAKIFLLDQYKKDDLSWYVLSGMPSKNGSTILALNGLVDESSAIQNMFISLTGELMISVSADFDMVEDEYRRYFIICCSETGEILRISDLSETIHTYKIWEDNHYSGCILGCDINENYYIVEHDVIHVIDMQGNYVFGKRIDFEHDVTDVVPGEETTWKVFAEDNKGLLFCHNKGRTGELIRIDPEDGKVSVLVRSNFSGIIKWYGEWDEKIYYCTNEDLMCWHVTTGEKEKLVSLVAAGVKTVPTGIVVSEQGEILLCCMEKKGLIQIIYDRYKPDIKNSISLVNMVDDNPILEGCIAEYSREHTEQAVSYETIKSNEERERIWMQIVSGQGPDLLMISRADLTNLYAQKLIVPMDEYLDDELMSQIIPGALALGSKESVVYGVPFDLNGIETMATNKELWAGEYWTPENISDILKTHSDLRGIFLDYFGQDDYSYNLYFWISEGVSSAWNPKTKEWDMPYLATALEWIKEKTAHMNGLNGLEEIKEKNYLGVQGLVTGLDSYCTFIKRCGLSANIVGYPSENGGGNYISAIDGVLVINQSAKDKPGISELMSYLLGKDAQLSVAETKTKLSIRLDVQKIALTRDSEPLFKVDGKELEKGDYLNQYLDFLISAIPRKEESMETYNIIEEEAYAYFHSNKALEETIEIIKSRMQIYFLENQN